jgi:hypothetical protein
MARLLRSYVGRRAPDTMQSAAKAPKWQELQQALARLRSSTCFESSLQTSVERCSKADVHVHHCPARQRRHAVTCVQVPAPASEFPCYASREIGTRPTEVRRNQAACLCRNAKKHGSFPVNSHRTGKLPAETGSLSTATRTTLCQLAETLGSSARANLANVRTARCLRLAHRLTARSCAPSANH